ncbi:MAG: folylpolyglutamate synthase/dihydrofolate synthase family protein [Candidatus Micrarchaeota archaeon]
MRTISEMNYPAAIAYLESLPEPDKWSLAVPFELALLCGARFNFEMIHVAGTNGKGSVCANIASILNASGHSTGLYTSPHLESYNERIQVKGRMITNSELAKAISDLKPDIEKMKLKGKCPSVFEALTVAALLYFMRRKVKFLVMETGMGGRLDATNIVPSRLQVLTSISFDHMRNLGPTLGKIASEKAGIIKRNSFVVSASSPPGALGKISSKARSSNSRLFVLGKDFSFSPKLQNENGSSFDYLGIASAIGDLQTPLPGLHQLENATLALAASECLRKLGCSIPDRAIRKGLLSAKWPGRLEIISKKPLVLLDGAHNIGGARRLKESLEGIFLPKHPKLILVVGIMADKDYSGILRLLAPLASELILTRASIIRAADPNILARSIGKKPKGLKISVIPDLNSAISHAKKAASPNDVICITGSLYVVGEARGMLLG